MRTATAVHAPEWRLGGRYTQASDWFALGQLLYHVCCIPTADDRHSGAVVVRTLTVGVHVVPNGALT